MTVETTKSVLAMSPGSFFKAFRGKVAKVADVRAVGTGTVQDLMCEEDGQKLKLSFWDHDNLPMSWEGRSIYVVANEQGKSLMYKVDNAINKKTGRPVVYRSVSVPADAEITQAAAGFASPAPRPNGQPPQHQASGNLETPERFAAKCSNALLLSMRAACYAGKEFEKISPGFVTPENFPKLALGILGALERAGMIDRMPVGAAKAKVVAPPPPPPPPPPVDDPPMDDEPPAELAPVAEDDVPFN